jgi:hypothetical protein
MSPRPLKLFTATTVGPGIVPLKTLPKLYARIDLKKVNFLSWPLALYNGVVNFSSEPIFYTRLNHCFFFIGILYRY